MLSYTALYNIYRHVKRIEAEGQPGAIVEMGCWNGGCEALMAWALQKNKYSRKVWLFDSFAGLPELTQEDASWAERLNLKPVKKTNENPNATGLYVAEENLVIEALKKLNVPAGVVQIRKGWFQHSVPGVKKEIGPIALLRLDGDTYESTRYCVGELYDQVVQNGVVVIDDYNLEGCRRALYEFFVERGIYPKLHIEPYGGRMFFYKQ